MADISIKKATVEDDIRRMAEDDPRENTRSTIAFCLLLLLAAVLGTTLAVMMRRHVTNDNLQTLKDLLQIVYSPLIALVSASTGFYFGNKLAEDAGRRTG